MRYRYRAIKSVNVESTQRIILSYLNFGRQHRKDIYLNLKPFRGNNNINKYIFHTKKMVQFKTSKKYLLLLLLLLGRRAESYPRLYDAQERYSSLGYRPGWGNSEGT